MNLKTKKKLKIAIFFDQELHTGGGYQQAINAASLMKKLPNNLYTLKFLTLKKKNIKILKKYNIQASIIKISLLEKFIIFFRTTPRFKLISYFFDLISLKSNFEKKLLKNNIDIIYFLSPTRLAADLDYLNYIYTVWDISHRDDLEFPEVRLNKEFEFRELKYKKILPKAFGTIVDSEFSKINIAKKYSIDEKRLHVIPYEPAYEIKEKKILNLEKNKFCINDKTYVYYPAQFWAHKNHTYIIDGVISLEKKYDIKINIKFSGGDKGNLNYVKKYVERKNLEKRVDFLGFVPIQDMISLYENALALVMPSYFGPTNIPPLEAFKLGVPVLYSDLDGLRDQIKDAGLLLNLNDDNSLSEKLYQLITEPKLRINLIKAGYKRLNEINSVNRIKIFDDLFKEFYRKNITFKF